MEQGPKVMVELGGLGIIQTGGEQGQTKRRGEAIGKGAESSDLEVKISTTQGASRYEKTRV